MYKPLIRNRMILYFVATTGISLLLFGLYALYSFKIYSEKNLIGSMFIHLRHSENVLVSECPDITKRDALQTLVFNLGDSMDLELEVIGQNGQVIAATKQRSQAENQLSYPEVEAALSGQKGSSIRLDKENRQKTVYVAMPYGSTAPYQAAVRASLPTSAIDSQFATLSQAMFIAFFLAVFLAGYLSIHLAKKFIRPLEGIALFASKLSAGNLEERIHYKGQGEFALLAHVLNNLAAGLAAKIKETSAEKQKLELILQHMDNPVLLFDKNGRITNANRSGVYIFGDNIVSRHHLQIIGSSALDTAIRTCLETNSTRMLGLKTTLNNAKYAFQVFIAPLPDKQDVLCVFHDITSLQAINEKQMEFVANASHELATPLTAIKGFAETLIDGASESPELRQKFTGIILAESERMQRLLTDLLQLARLESGQHRQSLRLEKVAARELLEEIREEFSPQGKRKNITLEISCQHPANLLATNRDWLKQALVNLTENALKYSPENSTVLLSYKENPDYGEFSVADSGIGIAAENLPMIFERFYQVDKSRARSKAGGTGLGLAIVKFIVEMLGGTIKVDSKPNIGATFTFTVPLAK